MMPESSPADVRAAAATWRAWGMAPADCPELLSASVTQGRCDAVIACLEDQCPGGSEAKQAARDALVRWSGATRSHRPLWLRINEVGGDEWAEDVRCALRLSGLTGLVVPKVERPEHLESVRALAASLSVGTARLPLIAMIETARGIDRVESCLSSGEDVVATIFGREDYLASIGATDGFRHPDPRAGVEHAYARGRLVNASAAAGMARIDGAADSAATPAEMEADAETTVAMGFTGKLAVSDDEVHAVHTAFSPRDQSVSWARDLLDRAHRGGARGGVTAPMVRRAELIVSRAGLNSNTNDNKEKP